MAKRAQREFTAEDLCDAGRSAIREVIQQIFFDAESDPTTAFGKVIIGIGLNAKQALRIDVGAEDTFGRQVHRYKSQKFRGVHVLGEERLDDDTLDLAGRNGTWVLADALDGTDLIELGLGNWCSAAVFFCPTNPSGKRILAAVVGLPNGDIYYSSSHESSVYVLHKDHTLRAVLGPRRYGASANGSMLSDITICFYGQKVGRLRNLNKLRLLHDNAIPASVRFHTLAGMPMMMKLIDHQIKGTRGVDIVFEADGQKPHDVVPGAYLCLKAGATLIDLDTGMPLTMEMLEVSLLRPSDPKNKLRYLIAGNDKLAKEILPLLREHSKEKTDA